MSFLRIALVFTVTIEPNYGIYNCISSAQNLFWLDLGAVRWQIESSTNIYPKHILKQRLTLSITVLTFFSHFRQNICCELDDVFWVGSSVVIHYKDFRLCRVVNSGVNAFTKVGSCHVTVAQTVVSSCNSCQDHVFEPVICRKPHGVS